MEKIFPIIEELKTNQSKFFEEESKRGKVLNTISFGNADRLIKKLQGSKEKGFMKTMNRILEPYMSEYLAAHEKHAIAARK